MRHNKVLTLIAPPVVGDHDPRHMPRFELLQRANNLNGYGFSAPRGVGYAKSIVPYAAQRPFGGVSLREPLHFPPMRDGTNTPLCSESQLTESQLAMRRRIVTAMVDEGLLFPLIYRIFQKYRRRKTGSDSLRSDQGIKLRRTLLQVFDQVPAFRSNNSELRELALKDPFEAHSYLPLMSKEHILEQYEHHCSDMLDPRRCKLKRTSGTTGTPLNVIYNEATLAHNFALMWVHALYFGDPFNRRILQSGRGFGGWFECASPARGSALVGRYELLESNNDSVAAQIGAFYPSVITGTPSRLARLIDLYDELEGDARIPKPLVVYSHSEELDCGTRKRIIDAFSTSVRDVYGMSEVLAIATECELQSYHIESERIWLQVVGADGNNLPDGEVGELVVTDLLNTAMPFLRYRTGDLGALARTSCACGRPQKVLRLLTGRGRQVVELAVGLQTDLTILKRAILKESVRRFQIVSRAEAQLEVLVQPSSVWSESDTRSLRVRLHSLLPGLTQVVVTPVEAGAFHEDGPGEKAVDFVRLW